MIRFLAIMLCFGAATSRAETVSMRSGEHEGFSRIVLDIPTNVTWALRDVELGYQLELGTPVDTIETDGVFDRIPRSRLNDIQTDGPVLDLIVGCDCYIDAFLFNSTMLVVDILDDPAPPDTVMSPFPTESQTVEMSSWFDGSDVEEPAPISPTIQPAFPLFNRQDALSSFHPDIFPRVMQQVSSGPALVDAERRIMESFAQAATQGIFDFPAIPLTDNGAVPSINLFPTDDTNPGELIPSAIEDAGGPGFAMHTGIDLASVSLSDDQQNSSCPIPTSIDVNGWGEPNSFGTVVPTLRQSITNDAGHQSDDAIIALAKAYIYYGFGAEAQETLLLLSSPHVEADFLGLLAQLIDQVETPIADLLPFRQCGASMELWLALAGERISASDEATMSAIIIAYRALPDSLRGHIGLRLAQILSQAGALNTAQEILDSALQEMTGDSRESAFVQVSLVGHADGPEAELAQLEPLIESNFRASPQDMVRLLELAQETEATLSESVLELSEVMRFEEGGSETSVNLFDAEIRTLLQNGLPFSALEMIASDPESLEPEHLIELRSAVAITIVETASDEEFLNFAFDAIPTEMSDEAQNSVAERLISNGFIDRAQSFIGSDAAALDAQTERLALRQLVDASQIQAVPMNELLAVERTLEPVQATEPAFIAEAALSEAWRSGDWDVLTGSDDQLLGFAGREIQSSVASTGSTTPLADSSALLENSQITRELTSELLERFSVDD